MSFSNRYLSNMNRFNISVALVVALLALIPAIGCQKKSADTNAAKVAVPPAPPTPEESFATIVETFRRGVEEVPIGFFVQDSSGSQTMMTGKNTVAHKLVPPQKEGDPLKAEIKVTSSTQYTLQRSTEQSEADKTDQPDDTGDSSNEADVEIFDSSVASAPNAASKPRATPGKLDAKSGSVLRQPNTFERTYELVYENGRWKLLTELDPKTEESIKLAFDRALGTQS
jgi:hypothetical protein